MVPVFANTVGGRVGPARGDKTWPIQVPLLFIMPAFAWTAPFHVAPALLLIVPELEATAPFQMLLLLTVPVLVSASFTVPKFVNVPPFVRVLVAFKIPLLVNPVEKFDTVTAVTVPLLVNNPLLTVTAFVIVRFPPAAMDVDPAFCV